jgi:hypothetical protein
VIGFARIPLAKLPETDRVGFAIKAFGGATLKALYFALDNLRLI